MKMWSKSGLRLLGLTSLAAVQISGVPVLGQVQIQVQAPALPAIPGQARPAATPAAGSPAAAPVQVAPGAARPVAAPVQVAPGTAVRPAAAPVAAPAQVAPGAAAPAAVQANPAAAEVIQRLAGFVKAYNDRNVAAMVDFFTDDAALVGADGTTLRGKDAIKEQFTAGFAQPSQYTLESAIEGTRFLTPDVVQLEGVSKLSAPNEGAVLNRFVSLATRANNAWRIAEIRDMPVSPGIIAPADRLAELEWMVGDWVSQSPESNAKTTSKVYWGPKKAYLIREATEQMAQEEPRSSLMIVTWDPQSNQIKSWLFDSEGSHGVGSWARAADNQWVVRAQGAHADGISASATQLLTLENPNALRTSSVDRVSDGLIIPDKDEVLMVRQPPTAPGGGAVTPAAPGAATAR